ncbi:hypothetical protein [Piscibacillus halophilus]|uniref:Uncharacterized protein n=1 Tax=Piscibacillus halophilus TaxID=571933 RepID=A0A1H9J3D9_9BACI|nr:hypothetical protein [Piscibacillus halophilus]SEQ81286.1 hypothetical protein SAMN05216362_12829 [Piscibacillus halophilus]
MGFLHHLVIFFVIAVIAFILRFVQIRLMIRVDIYLFVFGPLIAFGFLFLFFGLIDLNRALFLDIGKLMFLYGAVGFGCGFGATRALGGRF